MPARLSPRLARCPPRSPLPSCPLASRNVHSAPSNRARYDWSKSRSAISGDNDSFDPSKLRRLSAEQLSTHRAPPKGVKVLVRDFIHDALYNPHYGYFSHRAVIFSPPAPLDFRQMRNAAEFDETVARVYADISQARGTSTPTIGAQLWHTPVELFQPWYGRAIASALASRYLLRHFPYEDMIIYEMGGGNGTLSRNILDWLRDEYPEVYERTSYRIIEISPALAANQRVRLKDHAGVVEVINKSIFDWEEPVHSPCFFLALEVIDNFAHDVVTLDAKTAEPYQGLTATSPTGDYEEIYEPVSDPLIGRYLSYRDASGHLPAAHSNPITSHPLIRRIRQNLPFAPNITQPEFIPTQLVRFLELLRDKFPRHRLLLSDFSSLPDVVEGAYNAPVVQTRYKGTMIPCSTYMVQPGYFDIFFPTDFSLLLSLYSTIMGSRHQPVPSLPPSPSSSRLDSNFFFGRTSRHSPLELGNIGYESQMPKVYSQKEFLLKYADLEQTTLRNGENPLLDYYTNVKVMF